MIILAIVALIAGAGLAAGWAERNNDPAEDMSNHEHDQIQPEPKVSIEKHREYDEDTRTLTETVTTRKVFPDIDPWELDEEE